VRSLPGPRLLPCFEDETESEFQSGFWPLFLAVELGSDAMEVARNRHRRVGGFVFAVHLRPETRQGLVPRLIPTDNPGGGHFYRATIAPPSSILHRRSSAVAVAVYMVNCATCSLFA